MSQLSQIIFLFFVSEFLRHLFWEKSSFNLFFSISKNWGHSPTLLKNCLLICSVRFMIHDHAAMFGT